MGNLLSLFQDQCVGKDILYCGKHLQNKRVNSLKEEQRSGITESGIEVAFRHFGHVKFMKELALVSFFTQSTQPVLADNSTIGPQMTVWAEISPLTLAFGK